MAHDYLSTDTLMEHVMDSEEFHFPRAMGGEVKIPQPFKDFEPKELLPAKLPIPAKPLTMRLTKFMVLEVIAAFLIAFVFIRLARKISTGKRPTGKFWNFFESMIVFIRDEVARPAIGHHDGDKFLPFLWTMFFFILFNNLLGMLPWMGAATGGFGTTLALAFGTFLVVVGSGMKKMGFVGFFKSLVPHMELPLVMAIVIFPMVFLIEIAGLLIKHFILAVRLVANMMAGHLVLATLIAFIGVAWNTMAVYGVAPASVLGATALSLLELFVAFLQAYIFTFLSALFIGMAVHPH